MNRKTIVKMCLCEFSDKKGGVLFARRARSGCKPEGPTRDEILDNITLYWLTNTAISSVRLYWTRRIICRQAASSTHEARSFRSV